MIAHPDVQIGGSESLASDGIGLPEYSSRGGLDILWEDSLIASKMKIVTEKSQEKKPRKSTDHPSAWELGGLSIVQLGRRVWTQMDSDHDDTLGRAAELAYFFFLAIFPAAVFVLTLLGIVGTTKFDLRTALFNYASQALPPSAWELVQKTIDETLKAAKGWTLVVGLLGALWSASSGTSSLMTVLNFTYNVKERRPWWKTRLMIAMLLTIALSGLMLVALGIVLFGGWAAQFASTHGLGEVAVTAWRVFQAPVALLFVVVGFAVLYYWGPDVEQKRWYWITPGSLVGVLLWVAASAGFRIYLHFFNSFSTTYGSLGAVIILLLWFYITSLALLVGAEINANIEHAAAEHGRADAKLKGEREAPAA